MKQLILYTSILLAITACNSETKNSTVVGIWSAKTIQKTKIEEPTNYFEGYLSSDIEITADSIFVFNRGFFLKRATTYHIKNDSLVLDFNEMVSYSMDLTDSSLCLNGTNFYNGFIIKEFYFFQRSIDLHNEDRLAELKSKKINLTQLNSMAWSIKPIENFEIISNSNKSEFLLYDSSSIWFPDTINFMTTDLRCHDHNNFQIGGESFKIVDFNMDHLKLEKADIDKRYRLSYENINHVFR